jgi:microcystin-dependent protein
MTLVGEIRLFAGNFAPVGWAICNGAQMPISENDALFTLIGTTYGGDGQEIFNLPNLQSRVPIHQGSTLGVTSIIGESGGAESVTLTSQQIPIHTHAPVATADVGIATSPNSQVLAAIPVATASLYGTDAPLSPLAPQTLTPVGGSQPHDNMQPYLCLNFIISLYGEFPQSN